MPDAAVIIMAKEPRVGQTKTRLTPPLTPVEAARLYEAFLKDTIDLVIQVEAVDLAIAISPVNSISYFEKISPASTTLIPVECNHIGGCLSRAIGFIFDQGYKKAVALNADGPSLPAGYIGNAVRLLDQCDIVLGPSKDGGYYLIGMNELHTGVFSGINWSTPSVLEDTQLQINRLGLTTAVLPSWYDIDTADDLNLLIAEIEGLPQDRLPFTREILAGIPGFSTSRGPGKTNPQTR